MATVRGDNSAKTEADMREFNAKLTEEQSKRNAQVREKMALINAEPDQGKRDKLTRELLALLA